MAFSAGSAASAAQLSDRNRLRTEQAAHSVRSSIQTAPKALLRRRDAASKRR